MYLSGYNSTSRREILLSGLRGFQRMEEQEKRGERSLNRRRGEDYHRRMLKRHGAKKTWYKGKSQKDRERRLIGERSRGKQKIDRVEGEMREESEAVMFVPPTPGGELVKLLQEGDERAREGTKQRKVKFVERGVLQ